MLKLDVAKFFPSLDHGVLKERLRRVLKDPRVLGLCDTIIDGSNEQEQVTHFFPGDGLLAPLEHRHGIPIGNLTSQFFANVYLDALDHFVTDQLGERRYSPPWRQRPLEVLIDVRVLEVDLARRRISLTCRTGR